MSVFQQQKYRKKNQCQPGKLVQYSKIAAESDTLQKGWIQYLLNKLN